MQYCYRYVKSGSKLLTHVFQRGSRKNFLFRSKARSRRPQPIALRRRRKMSDRHRAVDPFVCKGGKCDRLGLHQETLPVGQKASPEAKVDVNVRLTDISYRLFCLRNIGMVVGPRESRPGSAWAPSGHTKDAGSERAPRPDSSAGRLSPWPFRWLFYQLGFETTHVYLPGR